MLLSRRHRLERANTVERLYGAIVAQARRPFFYAELGVPDTMEGRFDLMVLHVHLLFRRLSREGPDTRAIGQAVFDRFCEDMDSSLREMGVGDLAVPRRMRAIGEAYYGRAATYDAALAAADDTALAPALRRNVYGSAAVEPDVDPTPRLTRYVRKAVAALDAQDATAITCGDLSFPSPEEA